MGWFRPKLEPGERVVKAVPGPDDQGLLFVLAVFLFIMEGALAVAMDSFLGLDRDEIAVVLGAGLALIALGAARWKLVVTDRRLLHRRGLRSRVLEIRLDDIESVRTGMGAFTERIVVRACGRETQISMLGVDPAPIARALRGESVQGAAS